MYNYKIGDVIEVVVSGIERYGIFVNVNNKYSGLIHISEISNSFVKNINDYAQLGDVLKVKIIGIDEKKCQLKLSIKENNSQKDAGNYFKIVETPKGFSTLEVKLEQWIEEKEKEILEEQLKKL